MVLLTNTGFYPPTNKLPATGQRINNATFVNDRVMHFGLRVADVEFGD